MMTLTRMMYGYATFYGKRHITATIGSNIIRAVRITSLLRKQKHHFFSNAMMK